MSQVHIASFSEMDCFRQCPLKHELAYKERWVAPKTSPALARGTDWHAVMETHYLRKQQCDKTKTAYPTLAEEYEFLCNRHLLNKSGDWQDETAELIAWMLSGYLEEYGWDEDWRVLGVEHAAQVWLPTPQGTRSRIKLKLKIDLVIKTRDTGKIWVVDHKSCRDLPKEKNLAIDDQFGLYTWGMRQLGRTVFGSIHNAARTQRNKTKPQPLDERFMRRKMHRTDFELDTIAVEAYKTLRRAYSIKPGEAERAPDPDRCGWRCDYTEACLYGRKVQDGTRRMLADTGFVVDRTRH